MKAILSLLLPAIAASGAVATPILNINQSMDTSSIAMYGNQEEPSNPNGQKRYHLLEDDETTRGLTTEAKIETWTQDRTQVYASLIEAQASLDELLAVDTSLYTEEELLAYQEEVDALEATIADLEAHMICLEERLEVMEGTVIREQLRTKIQANLEDSIKAQVQAMKTVRAYEMKAGITTGTYVQAQVSLMTMDGDLTALEDQLMALYDTDTSSFTQEELDAYYAQIDLLEAQLLALNERMEAAYNQYCITEQKIERARNGYYDIAPNTVMGNAYSYKHQIAIAQDE